MKRARVTGSCVTLLARDDDPACLIMVDAIAVARDT